MPAICSALDYNILVEKRYYGFVNGIIAVLSMI
jgi:hypothetical protein